MVSKEEHQKLERFCDFCVMICVPWWLTSSIACAAPNNNLKLIKQLSVYKNVDKEISESALGTMMRRRWYLTGELVPLSLFDKELVPQVREEVALEVLKFQNQIFYTFYNINLKSY